ncbi:sensor histidine kinase [Planotetraspora sp. GP83]|uniref:sensor histidine kinase n=1 Tax=Planotetraspora sp. GP83 TaxID=3156264 RepID=UPI00351775F6
MSQRRPPTWTDWLVAVIVGLFAVAEEVSGRTAAPGRPQAAWWIAAGIAAAALVLLFSLLSEVRLRSVKAGTGLAATAAFVGSMLALSSPPAGWGDVAVALVMSAIAAGAGMAVRRHRIIAIQAEERGELLAREAVSEERARIARELHDIVAHSVSVMTMQTGGVRLMLREDQDRERQVLAVIEETGRGAVEELRRMLGLLRGPDSDGLTPQPGLDRLDDLLDHVRSAGLDVKAEIQGDPQPLPAGLDLSAYRIVQEALTNALKHAGPTDVAVTIAYRPRELTLEIVDQGPRDSRTRGRAEAPERRGHGLVGMRERVALFHGSLATGPRPSGGYGVRAVLPL